MRPREQDYRFDTHDLANLLPGADAGWITDPDFSPALPRSSAEAGLLAESRTQRLVAVAQQRERVAGELPGTGARQWLPPSRRHVHRGLYLPSMRSERLALDNSGSCESWLGDFLGEVHGILSTVDGVSLRLLVFDTRITSDTQLDHKASIPWRR